VLSHAEDEAQWLGACVDNFELNSDDVQFGAVKPKMVPKPDRPSGGPG
jgi:hypothetical protein